MNDLATSNLDAVKGIVDAIMERDAHARGFALDVAREIIRRLPTADVCALVGTKPKSKPPPQMPLDLSTLIG